MSDVNLEGKIKLTAEDQATKQLNDVAQALSKTEKAAISASRAAELHGLRVDAQSKLVERNSVVTDISRQKLILQTKITETYDKKLQAQSRSLDVVTQKLAQTAKVTEIYGQKALQAAKANEILNEKLEHAKIKTQNLRDAQEKNSKSSESGIATYLASAISIGMVTSAIAKSITAFDEKNRAMNKTKGLLTATGYASGMTAKEIYNLADALELASGIDADDILGGQNMLLSFKRIGKEIFPEVSRAMVDLAARMDGDVAGAATALGKALNNPIEASTLLKKAKIDLSVEQEKEIAGYQKAGELAKAQKVILDELKNSVGGLAVEIVSPLDQMKIGFGDVFEVVGEALYPALKDLMNNVFIPMVNWIKQNKEAFVALATTIAGVGLVLTGPLGIGAALIIAVGHAYVFRDKFIKVFYDIEIAIVAVARKVIQTFESLTSVLGVNIVKKATTPVIDFLNKTEADLNKKLADLKAKAAADKQKTADDEKREQEKAAKGGLIGGKKAKKDSTDDARKTEVSERQKEINAELKSWEKKYGKLSADDKAYLHRKEDYKKASDRKMLDEEKASEKARNNLVNLSDKDRFRAMAKMNDSELKDIKKTMKREEIWKLDAAQEEIKDTEKKERKKWELENDYGTSRVDGAMTLANNLAAFQQSKSREAFELGKAGAIAETTISTYKSAQSSYDALAGIPVVGPVLGGIAAAAAIGAGFMRVQAIESQDLALADGAVLTGPTRALIGEAGPEVAIPLRDNGPGIPFMAAALEKSLRKVGGIGDSQKSGPIYQDNRRITNVFKGTYKEQVEMFKNVLKDEAQKKARKDQNVRGRR